MRRVKNKITLKMYINKCGGGRGINITSGSIMTGSYRSDVMAQIGTSNELFVSFEIKCVHSVDLAIHLLDLAH